MLLFPEVYKAGIENLHCWLIKPQPECLATARVEINGAPAKFDREIEMNGHRLERWIAAKGTYHPNQPLDVKVHYEPTK